MVEILVYLSAPTHYYRNKKKNIKPMLEQFLDIASETALLWESSAFSQYTLLRGCELYQFKSNIPKDFPIYSAVISFF